jgi:glutamate racemase
VTGDDVAIVDSADTTAGAVADALAASGMGNQAGGASSMRFFATDSPERFAQVGATFLGRQIDAADVELIDLRPGATISSDGLARDRPEFLDHR